MVATPALFDVPAVPALRLASRFARRNRLLAYRRLDVGQRLILIAVAAAAVIVMAAVAYRFCTDAPWWLDPLCTHLAVVALAAAWIARSRVARIRRVAEERFALSWLAVAPIEARAAAAMVRVRAMLEVVIALAIASGLIAAAGAINAVQIWNVNVAVVAGGIGGTVVGWWSGGRPTLVRAATGVRVGHRRGDCEAPIGLGALGRWAFAERIARLRPRIEARVFGALLLSLPMGIPPLIAMLLLLSLVIVVVATSLLTAQLAIVPRAADWLRTTPLTLRNFAIHSASRVCVWQCVYTIAMAVVLAALGTESRAIGCTAAAWLAWVAVSTLTALALRHRPGRVRIELFALGTLLAGLATIAIPLALVAVSIIAVVQWKRAEAA